MALEAIHNISFNCPNYTTPLPPTCHFPASLLTQNSVWQLHHHPSFFTFKKSTSEQNPILLTKIDRGTHTLKGEKNDILICIPTSSGDLSLAAHRRIFTENLLLIVFVSGTLQKRPERSNVVQLVCTFLKTLLSCGYFIKYMKVYLIEKNVLPKWRNILVQQGEGAFWEGEKATLQITFFFSYSSFA